MRIDIVLELDGYTAQTESYLNQVVRPAIADGMNAAAEMVKAALIEELHQDIESPSPFTLNAFGIMPATHRDGKDPDAIVFIKDIQAEYLGFQIDGGVRRAGDYATTKSGPIVPGPHGPTDQYGNLPRGFVAQALAEPHVSWTKMRKGSGYTALVRSTPGQPVQLLAFILPEIEYEQSFDFYDTAIRAGSKALPAAVSEALELAAKRVVD